MTEYIVGHVLKAITYHRLLLKICTCGTIRGCTTIKINHENKVICTQIVMHCATIRICTINRVNTAIKNVTGAYLIMCAYRCLLTIKLTWQSSCVITNYN